MKPVLYYYWQKQSQETSISEFDPATGKERGWQDDPAVPDRVRLLPFDHHLAQKVQEAEQIPAVADDLPEWEIEPCGHDIEVFKRGYYTHFDYYVCSACHTAFQWFGRGRLACPECGTHNEWYCDACDTLIENPLFMQNGEVRCPACEERGVPRGLLKIEKLIFVESQDLCANQVVRVPGKFEIEVGPDLVRVKVL